MWDYKGWTESGQDWYNPSHPDQQIFFNSNPQARGYHWILGNAGNGPLQGHYYMQHVRYVAANAAFTVQLANLFGGIDENRKFDASLHAGPTFFHVFPHLGLEAYDSFGVNGGIQGQYHLNERVGFFLELNGSIMPDGFDGHYGGDTFDLIGQTLAGVTYKIPAKQRLVQHRPVVIDDNLQEELDRIRAEIAPDAGEIIDLTPEIDRLRQLLSDLSTTRTEVIDPDKKSHFLPDPVHFEINKSIIRDSELAAIEKAVAYLTKYPDAKVVVTGYADKDTGTKAINERLSRERSQNVADALTNKHNIEKGRVSIDWQGDRIQPFFRNNMNRAVLFYVEFEDLK